MSSFAYVDGMSFVFVAMGREWECGTYATHSIYVFFHCVVLEIEMCRHFTSESYDIPGDLRDLLCSRWTIETAGNQSV